MQSLSRRMLAAAFPAVCITLASFVPAATAAAAVTDYRFELVSARPIAPGKTDVTVRLVHAPDGKPVNGAVIFQAKVHMGPSGMAEMTGKAAALAAAQPGVYRFQTETDMAGTWALTLSAKVQGEAQTVNGTVSFDVAQ
jgi:hypothetical protein